MNPFDDIKSGEIIMGVGNGGGNHFVKGDYDSITVLQQKLFELEDLRRENRNLKDEIELLKSEILKLTFELNGYKQDSELPGHGIKPTSSPNYPSFPWDPNNPIPNIVWCSSPSLDGGEYFPAKSF